MGQAHDVIADLRQPTRDLRRAIPDTWGASARSTSRRLPMARCPGR